ncbi:hypothetical protein OC845_005294 [Tilletia horrida]|nr:hypothetical protein OC845_005294 [Tilletia horrida]
MVNEDFFDDDDLWDSITEEDLVKAEFQATQQLKGKHDGQSSRSSAAHQAPTRAPQIPPQRNQNHEQQQYLRHPPPLQQHNHRSHISNNSPYSAQRPQSHRLETPPARAVPGPSHMLGQSVLGRMPGVKRAPPPETFKPPFKKPKIEPGTTPQPTSSQQRQQHQHEQQRAQLRTSNQGLRPSALISPEKPQAGFRQNGVHAAVPAIPPSPPTARLPSQVPSQRHSQLNDQFFASQAVNERHTGKDFQALALAEEEKARLLEQLEQVQSQLWAKQGEDKMLRQKLVKAEQAKITAEREADDMRKKHQEELRKVTSQKDEDLKRMHDEAQFRIAGLRTPTKSAERRRQESDRRILSQDSPTRKARVEQKAMPAGENSDSESFSSLMVLNLRFIATAFPSFDNSFVVPALPRSKIKGQTPAPSRGKIKPPETPRGLGSDDFDDLIFDAGDLLSSPPAQAPRAQAPKDAVSPATTPQAERVQPPIATTSSPTSPAAWKLWARQTYTVRCNTLISDILSYSSPLPNPVTSLPRSQLLPLKVEPAPSIPPHPLTIHRLMNIRLPADAHPKVRFLWDKAMERLLEMCADAGRNLNDSFFVHPNFDSVDREKDPLNDSERVFWAYQEQIEDAMLHLLQGLAAVFRILTCVLLRLCMLDVLSDILWLLSRTMTTSSNFIHAILLPENPMNLLAMSLDSMPDDASEQGYRVTALLQPPPFAKMLIEAVRKTYKVPLRVAHAPSSAAQAAAEKASVKGKEKEVPNGRAGGKQDEDEAWDMGAQSRREVLAAVTACLRCLDLSDPQARIGLVSFVEEPGMVMTYLHANTHPEQAEAMLSILLRFPSAQYEWMNVLACDFAPDLPDYHRPMRDRCKTPLLEVLGAQLAAGNEDWTWEESHLLHSSTIVFLSQLLIYHGDAARTYLGQSKDLLAAIIKTTHRDSTAIWVNADLVDRTDEEELGRAADRICMNLQYLWLLVAPLSSNIQLADLMRNFEGQTPHCRGLRQLFNVAMGRIALVNCPDYLRADREDFAALRAKLDRAYDMAQNILDCVLTPDENQQLWAQMTAITEDPEEGGDDDETQTQEDYDGDER